MIETARVLVERFTPIPPASIEQRANCFNAVQLYWNDSFESRFVGPEEFVAYIQAKFKQVNAKRTCEEGDVSIIWSRSSDYLAVGHVQIDNLLKNRSGYPFGLTIEHTFVSISEDLVFQKRDPTKNGPYEMICTDSAIAPYQSSKGFEMTHHRRI